MTWSPGAGAAGPDVPVEPVAGPAGTGPAPAPAPRRGRRGYWLPGCIAIAALLVIGGAIGAGDLDHGSPTVLHGPDVAQQIALALQVQEGTHAPPAVRCPQSEPVRDGWRFVCTRTQGRAELPIQVLEIDARGHLRWHLGG